MKRIKQIFMFVLMFGLMTVLFVTLGTSASAATYGDLTYKIENGEVAITDCNESATEVVIPEKIAGYPVTTIGDAAFYNCSALAKINIPDSVKTIGSEAFYKCKALTSVTIPDSVTRIGIYAFYNCTGLTSVYISDIDKWCNVVFADSNSNPLYYAGNLYVNKKLVKNLILPDSVTNISNSAFSGCSSLTSVTIPDSVTRIGGYAFYN